MLLVPLCCRRVRVLRLLALVLALHCFAVAFSNVRDTSPVSRRAVLNPLSTAARKPRSSFEQPTTLFVLKETDTESTELSEAKHDDDLAESTEKIKEKRTSIILGTLASSLTAVTVAAKTGILRGPLLDAAAVGEVSYGLYTDDMILRDIGSVCLAAPLAYVLVKAITLGYEKGIYDSKVARKLSHTFSAPLYMLVYPIFSAADGARFFAGVVTLVNVLRLYLAGIGYEPGLANSVSRSGDKSEALGGPFIYVCLFQVFLLLFWRTNPIGIVAMSQMAAGDGMADLIGRRYGANNKWWFSDSKSIIGTVAFAVSSSMTSFGLLTWLSAAGSLELALGPMDLALRIVGISVACAIIELLPIGDDNYTVPLSAAALAALFLQ